MMTLTSGKTVTCSLNGDYAYDREVGRCALQDGRDLGEELIRQGICGRCARHDILRAYAPAQRAGTFSGAYPSYCWGLW